jgi:hypothetical protein
MRRVRQMAWAAWGKASLAATVTALRVRCSSRPWPRSCCRAPAGTCRQGSRLSWAYRPGWFFLTVILSFRVRQDRDLRRPVADSVADGTLAA